MSPVTVSVDVVVVTANRARVLILKSSIFPLKKSAAVLAELAPTLNGQVAYVVVSLFLLAFNDPPTNKCV